MAHLEDDIERVFNDRFGYRAKVIGEEVDESLNKGKAQKWFDWTDGFS